MVASRRGVCEVSCHGCYTQLQGTALPVLQLGENIEEDEGTAVMKKFVNMHPRLVDRCGREFAPHSLALCYVSDASEVLVQCSSSSLGILYPVYSSPRLSRSSLRPNKGAVFFVFPTHS